MFKQKITETPFSSEAANHILGNITSDITLEDPTFISTLRALLGKRLPEGESLVLSVKKQYGNITAATVLDFLPMEVSTIRIFENNSMDAELFLSLIEKNFPMWERLPKITEFYRKSFPVTCFVNRELKSVFIMTKMLEIQEFRFLQCSIPVFLPWYFEGENTPSETDMRLLESLMKKSPETYLECLAKEAEKYDFEKSFVKKLLGGFETRADRILLEKAENQIASYIRDIEQLNRQIGAILSRKSQEEIKLLGLKAKIESCQSGGSEIEEYFLSNKSISLVSADDREINFICRGELEYFDEEMVGSCLENKTSYIYSPRGRKSGILPDDMAILIREIFINHRLKMRMCAAYKINLNGAVYGQIGYDYGYRGEGCMPNPHIDKYACLGNYQRAINSCLMAHDYISAIENCVASCKSLNFGDYTVMDTFMEKMYRGTQKCIVLPNGETVTIKSAIEWLKKQEDEENVETD